MGKTVRFEFNFRGTLSRQEAFWNGKIYGHTTYIRTQMVGMPGKAGTASYKLDLTPGSGRYVRGSMEDAICRAFGWLEFAAEEAS